MTRWSAPLLLVLGASPACTPDADSDETGETGADTVPVEVSQDRLLSHVETLASAAYGGRSPGTEGGELAATYLEEHFSRLGLTPAGEDGTFRAWFDVSVFEATAPAILELDGQALVEGDDFDIFSGSGAGDVTGELVFAGYGLTIPPFDPAAWPDCPLDPAGYDDYAGVEMAGRIALVLRHGPNDDEHIQGGCPGNEAMADEGELYNFGYKTANAALHGATGLVLVNDLPHESEHAQGNIGDAYADPAFPSVFADRDAVLAHVPDLPTWAATLDATLTPQARPTGITTRVGVFTEYSVRTVPNVLATLPGTDPALQDEVVVVGAHFDHMGTAGNGDIYYGADDNASGTAVVLELAEACVEAGLQPGRTILFAGFNAEELGLLGSMTFVRAPTVPLETTVAMVNLDMVGGGDDSGVNVFGSMDGEWAWLMELVEDLAPADFPATLLPSMPNSDHASFLMAGVPAVMLLSSGEHPVYHTPEDTFETIDGAEMESVARVAADTLQVLAAGQEASPVSRRSGGTERLPAADQPDWRTHPSNPRW